MEAEGGSAAVPSAGESQSAPISKILNFSPNRALTFSPDRELLFDPGRELTFAVARNLTFNAWRGVPFGKAGVFFRGYVCPACRRVTLPGTTKCQWCKATFDEPMFYIREDIAKDMREWNRASALTSCPACGARNPNDAKFCIECGDGLQRVEGARTGSPAGLQQKAAAKRRPRVKVVE